jgi:hypothetical protein
MIGGGIEDMVNMQREKFGVEPAAPAPAQTTRPAPATVKAAPPPAQTSRPAPAPAPAAPPPVQEKTTLQQAKEVFNDTTGSFAGFEFGGINAAQNQLLFADGPETTEAERIKNANEMWQIIKQLGIDIADSPKSVVIPTIIGFIILFICAILAIIYAYRLQTDMLKAAYIKNPLNTEAVDYNLVRSMNVKSIFDKSIRYKYVLLVIMPMIAFFFIIIGFIQFYKYRSDTKEYVQILLVGCAFQAILSIIVNTSVYYASQKHLKRSNNSINDFNKIVYGHIYKKANFLNILGKVPTNSFSMMKAIQIAMNQISKKEQSNVDAIAQVLFTINLYIHIQKIGFKNSNIYDAFQIFNITSFINRANFSPSDFLFRKSMYMTNYCDQIKNIYSNELSDLNLNVDLITPRQNKVEEAKSIISPIINFIVGEERKIINKKKAPVINLNNHFITIDTFNKASSIVTTWINDINERGNTFNPDESFKTFFVMVITITFTSILPILFYTSIFGTKKNRERVKAILKFVIRKLFVGI